MIFSFWLDSISAFFLFSSSSSFSYAAPTTTSQLLSRPALIWAGRQAGAQTNTSNWRKHLISAKFIVCCLDKKPRICGNNSFLHSISGTGRCGRNLGRAHSFVFGTKPVKFISFDTRSYCCSTLAVTQRQATLPP